MNEPFDLDELGSIPDPLAGRSLTASAAATPGDAGPTRAAVARKRIVALGVVALWLSGAAFGLGLKPAFGADPIAIAFDVLLPAVCGAAALYLALAPGRLGLGPRARLAMWVALVIPIGVAALSFVPELVRPWPAPSALWHGVRACATCVVVISTVPLLALAVALRRGSPNNAVPRAILVGVAVSLLSASSLAMHCTETAGIHIAMGHVLPVVLLAMASALLIRRAAKAD